MLIDLSKDQIEYLVEIFNENEDALDDFEAEILETLQMSLEDLEHYVNDQFV